jgi:uncharacterized GH25 family protein
MALSFRVGVRYGVAEYGEFHMKRFAITAVSLLVIAGAADCHFVYLVPDNATGTIKAVFSDTLKPDDKVNVEKIERTKLVLVSSAGKESALKWEIDKAGSFYKIAVPGTGPRIVAGVTNYGVLQRGEGKPFLLMYYSKAIIGDVSVTDNARLGTASPVEIVPVVADGKIRFQALVSGKPVAKAEMSVMVPGEAKSRAEIGDEKGITAGFDKAGMYGVNFRKVEAKAGDEKGKKYEEVRSYATLVVEFKPAK